jgi:hypothetical protein
MRWKKKREIRAFAEEYIFFFFFLPYELDIKTKK